MPDAVANPAPAQTTAPTSAPKDRRCRSLRVNGLQCNSTALLGQAFCHTHLHYRHPEFPKGKIVLPLLEDHSSIQLVLSQAAHGLFTCAVDPQTARSLAYICQVASGTLPRPVAPRLKPTDEKPPVQLPVSQVTLTPDGDLLGPEEAWTSPTAAKPMWSFDKWLLDRYCERLNMPIVSYDDVPASGWLTEDEISERHRDPSAFFHDFEQRILDARRQAEILDRLTPEERDACPFGNCDGHEKSSSPCNWCKLEMKERAERAGACALPPEPDPALSESNTPNASEPNATGESAPATLDHLEASVCNLFPCPDLGARRPVLGARNSVPGTRGDIELDNSSRSNIPKHLKIPGRGEGGGCYGTANGAKRVCLDG